jgi:hypothetical protein
MKIKFAMMNISFYLNFLKAKVLQHPKMSREIKLSFGHICLFFIQKLITDITFIYGIDHTLHIRARRSHFS